MSRKIVGVLLLLIAGVLLVVFYMNRRPAGLEVKGDGIIVGGLNVNDIVSLLGGIVSLVSGIVTLVGWRR